MTKREGTVKKIGFYELNSFSNINNSIRTELSHIFPDYEIVTIDIFKIVKNNLFLMIINLLNILWEYFTDLITGKKSINSCFTRNNFMFYVIRKIAAGESRKQNFEFTFQTQSLFDASSPNIPHFVYTDNTILANLSNSFFEKNQLPSKKWMEKEKQIYRNATIVFVMSKNVELSLQQDYKVDPNKIKLVYAGGNVSINKAQPKERDYLNKNILFVGGNWLRKGGPVLVEAFKRVLRKHPDARLTIVSKNAPLLDLPNCTVYGKLSLKEVAKKFEESSIFCLPTIVEPFGIVFLEAMMYKLPIVATGISAIPDFITHGENGYLVEQNNIDLLEYALTDLLSSSEKRRAFGIKSYEIYNQKYSWDKVANRIKKHILSVIPSGTFSLTPAINVSANVFPSETLN